MTEAQMKYRVILNGHETVEGVSAEAVVTELSRLQWPQSDGSRIDDKEYMREIGKRLQTQGKSVPRMCCAVHFLADLEKAGAIERVQ